MHYFMNKIITTIIFASIYLLSNGQQCDTSYYWSKAIRQISCLDGYKNKVIVCLNKKGDNILKSENFSYNFFDEEHNMKRIIEIKNQEIFEDYWLTEKDTLFNQFNYEQEFTSQTKLFYKYLAKKLKCTREARKNIIKKEVMISFIVDKNGNIIKINALTDYGYGLEDKVIKVIKSYKSWGVIKYENKPVSLYLRLPVNFIVQ